MAIKYTCVERERESAQLTDEQLQLTLKTIKCVCVSEKEKEFTVKMI